MRLSHGAGAGAVDHAGDTAFYIQAHIGVQRRPHIRDWFAKHGQTVFLDGFDQRLIASEWLHRTRQQQAAHVHLQLPATTGWPEAGRRLRDGAAQCGLDDRRLFFGDHAAVEFEDHRAGNHIGVGAALDLAHIEIGVGDAFYARADLQVVVVEGIERRQNVHGALQRVGATVGNGCMRHVAVDRDFKLQAAVMRHHHLVAETGRDHQVGFGQTVFQQPVRPQLTTVFLVVGEVQLDTALELGTQGFQGAHGKGEGGHVPLADRRSAPVHLAVDDVTAIGRVGPALAGRHHIAMGVEGNGWAVAVVAAHDQVGDALQTQRLHLGGGYGMFFGHQAHGGQQFGGALRVRRIVARRGVGRHLDQRLQKRHFFIEMRVDPVVEGLVGGLWGHESSVAS